VVMLAHATPQASTCADLAKGNPGRSKQHQHAVSHRPMVMQVSELASTAHVTGGHHPVVEVLRRPADGQVPSVVTTNQIGIRRGLVG